MRITPFILIIGLLSSLFAAADVGVSNAQIRTFYTRPTLTSQEVAFLHTHVRSMVAVLQQGLEKTKEVENAESATTPLLQKIMSLEQKTLLDHHSKALTERITILEEALAVASENTSIPSISTSLFAKLLTLCIKVSYLCDVVMKQSLSSSSYWKKLKDLFTNLMIDELKWYASHFPLPRFVANVIKENASFENIGAIFGYLTAHLKQRTNFNRSDLSVLKKTCDAACLALTTSQDLYNQSLSVGIPTNLSDPNIIEEVYKDRLSKRIIGLEKIDNQEDTLLVNMLEEIEKAFNRKQEQDTKERERSQSIEWTLDPSNLPRPSPKKSRKKATHTRPATSPASSSTNDRNVVSVDFERLKVDNELDKSCVGLPKEEAALHSETREVVGAAQALPETAFVLEPTSESTAAASADEDDNAYELPEFNWDEHFKSWAQLKKLSKSAQSAAAPTLPEKTSALEALCLALDGASPKFKTVTKLLDKAGISISRNGEHVCIMWVGHGGSTEMRWIHLPHPKHQKAGMKNTWAKDLQRAIKETCFPTEAQNP